MEVCLNLKIEIRDIVEEGNVTAQDFAQRTN